MNVPLLTQKYPDVPVSRENSKSVFISLKAGKKEMFPDVPPLSYINRVDNNNNKMGNIEGKNIYIGVTYSNKGGTKGNTQDTRFRNPAFREAVKIVLSSIGIEQPTYADFKEMMTMFDGHIDWLAWADRIEHPRYSAICWVVDPRGQRHGEGGVCLDLFGSTRAEAKMNIPCGFEFREWF